MLIKNGANYPTIEPWMVDKKVYAYVRSVQVPLPPNVPVINEDVQAMVIRIPGIPLVEIIFVDRVVELQNLLANLPDKNSWAAVELQNALDRLHGMNPSALVEEEAFDLGEESYLLPADCLVEMKDTSVSPVESMKSPTSQQTLSPS